MKQIKLRKMVKKWKFYSAVFLAIVCCFSVFQLELFSREKLIKVPGDSTLTSNPVAYRDGASTDIKFKMPGVVYDCLSRKPLRNYDGELIRDKSKHLQMSESGGEDPSARKNSFEEIFNKQTWGGKETGVIDKMNVKFKASGPGSDISMTMGCMALLHTIIEKLKIHLHKDVISIADIPCGDLQWMDHFLKTRKDVQYTGIDIVSPLIERHTNTYKKNPNINFMNLDVVNSQFNQSFDVVFSRQMMQHLKNSDIIRTLSHFSQSGTKYMIATTYSDLAANKELGSTDSIRFRTINLEKAPFNLVPPVCTYQEPILTDNYLGLWELPLHTIQT